MFVFCHCPRYLPCYCPRYFLCYCPCYFFAIVFVIFFFLFLAIFFIIVMCYCPCFCFADKHSRVSVLVVALPIIGFLLSSNPLFLDMFLLSFFLLFYWLCLRLLLQTIIWYSIVFSATQIFSLFSSFCCADFVVGLFETFKHVIQGVFCYGYLFQVPSTKNHLRT